jgi:hypothetical protein
MHKRNERSQMDGGLSHDVETSVDSRATVALWIDRIRGEYQEMPGLSLTEPQGQRLWGLTPSACREILEALRASGFLRRTYQGQYVRSDTVSSRRIAQRDSRAARAGFGK